MKPNYMYHLFVVVLVASAVYGLAAQDSPRNGNVPQAWEHLALPTRDPSVVGDRRLPAQINRLGDNGWELVDVSSSVKEGTTETVILYFKRPKPR